MKKLLSLHTRMAILVAGLLAGPIGVVADPSIQAAPCVNDTSLTCATGIDGLVVEGLTYDVDFVISSYNTAYCDGSAFFVGNLPGAHAAASAIASLLGNSGVVGPIGSSAYGGADTIIVPYIDNDPDQSPVQGTLAYRSLNEWTYVPNLYIGTTRDLDLEAIPASDWKAYWTYAVFRQPGADADCVADADDRCPNTVFPEGAPTSGRLGAAHYALTPEDPFNFTKGPAARGSYTLADTAGCSCEQIVESLGLGDAQRRFGCNKGVLDTWIMSLP